MIGKIWNSPTFMTWGNLTAKSSALLILLPMVLRVFSKEDIVVWYLYFTVVSLQLLIDFGFLPTFSRLFSYAYSGLSIAEIKDLKNSRNADGSMNAESIGKIYAATREVYSRLAFVSFLVAITAGSFMVKEPMERSTDPASAWGGWVTVILIASFSLYANSVVAFLQGINRVAAVQRWQMITSLLSVVTSAVTVLFSRSLFAAIAAYYIWQYVNYLINLALLKKFCPAVIIDSRSDDVREIISGIIWPTAWRSGFGIMMSLGLIQLSGMIVAKVADASQASSYMLALQIIRAISSFSQAPFYSKLPAFSVLYAKNEMSLLAGQVKTSMRRSFYVFCGMFFLVTLSAEPLLKAVRSNTVFPDIFLWGMMGLAFLFERYGAMLLQFYTLTNRIIWHIANGITGVIMILLTAMFYRYMGLYAFAASMLVGYAVFFVPYIAVTTYKEFRLGFFSNERNIFLPVLAVFIFMLLISYYLKVEVCGLF